MARNLTHLTSFRVPAWANAYEKFASEAELASWLRRRPKAMPLMMLGGGSNVLWCQPFVGTVLHMGILGIRQLAESQTEVVVEVGAGEPWHRFVMHCVRQGLGGVENLALIPGNVGAAPIQNIGAYGAEVSQVLHSVRALHLETAEVLELSPAECKLGYRHSVFKQELKGRVAIVAVRFRLSRHPHLNLGYGALEQELESRHRPPFTVWQVAQAVGRIRQSKLPDPEVVGNAGSFFKNPTVGMAEYERLKLVHPSIPAYAAPHGRMKLAAGWLIEQCGWRGKALGPAATYKKQALVLINLGNATGADVLALADAICESVRSTFGVELEREVNVVGPLGVI